MNLYRNNLTIGDIPQLDVVVPKFFPAIDNLVAYYKMDESSGTAYDVFGNKNLTNTSSVSFSAGKINNGAVFNGSNYLVNTSWYTVPSAVTLSLWYKTSNNYSGVEGIVCRKDNNSGARYIYGLVIDSDNKIVMQTYHSPTSTSHNIESSFTINDGSWRHFVGVFDFSNGTMALYCNNSLVGTSSLTNLTGQSGGLLTIGVDGSNLVSGKLKSGDMVDEVAYFDRALTSDEITQLYNNGNGLTYN